MAITTQNIQKNETLEEFLQSEHLKFQASINLPGGVKTSGSERQYLKDVIFNTSVQGKDVLDIGSSLGQFCIEAFGHGAATVTGLETSPQRIRQARKLAEFLNLSPNYIAADFEDWTAPPKSFDVILALNVLHHFYDPVHALRKMMSLCRERIILEVATIRWKDALKPRQWAMWPSALFAEQAPIVLLDNPERDTDIARKSFLFTNKSLSVLFNRHSKAFEPLQFYKPSSKARWIVEARRRKIGHLLVVSGVRGAGQQEFINRLLSSQQLRERFGLNNVSAPVITADRIDELPTGPIDTVIYNYDLLRPFMTSLYSHSRDPSLSLLSCADQITTITLVNKPATLKERMSNEPKPSLTRSKEIKRESVLQEQYMNGSFLTSWYNAWLEHSAGFLKPKDNSQIIISDDQYRELGGTEQNLEEYFS